MTASRFEGADSAASLILGIALTTTWLTLSSYFTPMLLTLGGISIFLTLWIAKRMRILDSETAPYATVIQGIIYFAWLFVEIIKANLTVVRAVLSPDMQVSPTMTRIPTPQRNYAHARHGKRRCARRSYPCSCPLVRDV